MSCFCKDAVIWLRRSISYFYHLFAKLAPCSWEGLTHSLVQIFIKQPICQSVSSLGTHRGQWYSPCPQKPQKCNGLIHKRNEHNVSIKSFTQGDTPQVPLAREEDGGACWAHQGIIFFNFILLNLLSCLGPGLFLDPLVPPIHVPVNSDTTWGNGFLHTS